MNAWIRCLLFPSPRGGNRWGDGVLTLLRWAIGWHFLYEGCWKLLQEDPWSCLSYLESASGPLAPVFTWMAKQSFLVACGDWAVQLALVAIGLALITGIGVRLAALGGLGLLAMFYGCQPPEPFAPAVSGADGRFFVIERNVLEAAGLIAVAARFGWRGWVRAAVPGAVVLAIFGGCLWQQKQAGAFKKVEVVTSATVKVHEFTVLSALKQSFAERTTLAGVPISPLALGGDLIAGHAHARDLIWTDDFMRRYNSGVTLGRTMRHCLFCGIDTVFAEPSCFAGLRAAAREVGGNPALFANCATAQDAACAKAEGAKGVYVRPQVADAAAKGNAVQTLAKLVADLKATGLPVGIGAEDVATVKFCVANGLVPSFWVLAFHSLDYPAATLPKAFNSIWCRDPEAAAAYMKTRPEPWVAIRVMAGGAIDPAKGYAFARKHGATAVAVDLLDYRIVDTVNGIVGNPKGGNRK